MITPCCDTLHPSLKAHSSNAATDREWHCENCGAHYSVDISRQSAIPSTGGVHVRTFTYTRKG